MDRIALFKSHFEKTKYILVNFTNFPVIKNTIKRIAYENAYESSIIFQPLLPMPTFLPNLRLMRPLSF